MDEKNIDISLNINAKTKTNTIKNECGEPHLRCFKWCFIAGLLIGILVSYFIFDKDVSLNHFSLPMDLLKFIFILCAVFGISFHTLFAFEAHKVSTKNESKYYFAHQYLFNFAGSFIGWIILYYFIFIRLPVINIANGLIWEDMVLIFVSFVGITGHLPYSVFAGKILSLK